MFLWIALDEPEYSMAKHHCPRARTILPGGLSLRSSHPPKLAYSLSSCHWRVTPQVKGSCQPARPKPEAHEFLPGPGVALSLDPEYLWCT
jgi:hypothetical protein